MYYLIKERKYFVDPHGSWDRGGWQKYVSTNERYKDLEKGVELYWQEIYNADTKTWEQKWTCWEEFDSSEIYATDGYNCEEQSIEVKEITEEQYYQYRWMIDFYNDM